MNPSDSAFEAYCTLLCLSEGDGSQIANFGKKPPQTHLISIWEWPKNPPVAIIRKSW